nr:putative reverse transcriptase domain-containing protein [Tanacetum cinerariifolium]
MALKDIGAYLLFFELNVNEEYSQPDALMALWKATFLEEEHRGLITEQELRSVHALAAKFVASAPLTSLLKPDNGIRPIAVGTIWRRLVSKVAMKGVGKEMSKYLSSFQFGVKVSGDAKAILHSVNQVLSEYHNDGSFAMLTVDFLNAFNLVDRSALLHEIKDNCKLLLHAWYLDDGTVIGDSEEVANVLDIIKLRKGLFPIDIRRPSSGVKLLGGAVSRDANFISRLAMRRVANAVDLMGLLPLLHDPHSELLLLRSCMGIAKLFFSLRTYQPVHMEEAALFFNKVFECLRASHAQDFLLAIPIDGLGQHMSPVEYQTILKYRLMIPLFSVDAICLICRKAWISAMKETPVNFLTDPSNGRSTLRPADILAALKVASGKVTKHEKACFENQHVFILFVFDSFGFLALEAVELLSRVQQVMHNNVMKPRSTDVVFKRIGFVIQKGLAA